MNTDTPANVIILWRDALKNAEDRCHIYLHEEIESYLVSLLVRFTKNTDFANQTIANKFLQAMQEQDILRRYSLAEVGDQCLLYSGFFPGIAERRQVKVRYFVDIGRSAYATISNTTSDLYGSLASQFVSLMDVLQSVNQRHVLLPLDAYELWSELGSTRALNYLNSLKS
ncbi:MAG TPA: hypothetical protein VL360_04285 [Gammaproteobacteria bacterium]|jgi:hypothetical protein|nr:hypothetical protein [Gammaproteobacteria bacterium]